MAVGGLTRLTGSGLSITEWEPLRGVLPPLYPAQWESKFDLYQATPEYRLKNYDMTLAQFRRIYLWEYFHRLLARLLGIFFVVPLVLLSLRGYIARHRLPWFGIVLVLGAFQAVVGWLMVQSGLVDKPFVSPVRLAIHFGLALLILGLLLWLLVDSTPGRARLPTSRGLLWMALLTTMLVWLQGVLGAMVAGMKAGLVCPSFPTMCGEWLPWAMLQAASLEEALTNPYLIQFAHRALGVVAVSAMLILGLALHQAARKKAALVVLALMALPVLQFAMGVATLLGSVPIAAASLHQLGGVACFAVSAVALAYQLTAMAPSAQPTQLYPLQLAKGVCRIK